MGFFSDLKEDLSQAVNELMPEDEQTQEEGFGDINEMLDRLDSIVVPEISVPEPERQEYSIPESKDPELRIQESREWEQQPAKEPEITDVLKEAAAEEVHQESQTNISEESQIESDRNISEESQIEADRNIFEESQIESDRDIFVESQMETNKDIFEVNLEAFAEENLVLEQEEESAKAEEPEMDVDMGEMLESALAVNDNSTVSTYKEEKVETVTENQNETKGESKVAEMINARMASDETSSITVGMTINGDVVSEGSVDLIGCVNGNIDILGKLNVTGYINGNSKAAEIYADNAKVNGEIVSEGAVKIGSSSVVIGNICATSAVIAGAVKGDIDVKGPVILDTSAIVMGNIKSKSVQINNGAVIEGMCSQCYAEVNPISFFDDYKPEMRNNKNNV